MKNNNESVKLKVSSFEEETILKYTLMCILLTTIPPLLAFIFTANHLYSSQWGGLNHVTGAFYIFELVQFNWTIETAKTFWELHTATTTAAIFGLYLSFSFVKMKLKHTKNKKQKMGLLPDSVPKNKKNGLVFAGHYNKQELQATNEDRGLVFGPSGAGKTVFLMHQLLSAIEKRYSFVCLDPKPEICEIVRDDLEKGGYTVIEIDAINGSADSLNLLNVVNNEGLDVFCAALIPIGDADPAWIKPQHEFLKCSLLFLRASKQLHCNLPNALLLLDHNKFSSGEEFLAGMTKSKSRDCSRLAQSLLNQYSTTNPVGQAWSELKKSLSYLSRPSMRHALKDGFSLEKLRDNKKPIALFLKFKESELRGPVGALLSAFYDNIIIYLSNKKLNKPVVLFVDEIGTIPPIDGLEDKINVLRSRNVPVWMYFQTVVQVEKNYGRNALSVFMSACPLRIFFRPQDMETAKVIEDYAGEVVVEKHSETQNVKCEISRSITTEKVPKIPTQKSLKMKNSEVVTFYGSKILQGIATPHYKTFKKYAR